MTSGVPGKQVPLGVGLCLSVHPGQTCSLSRAGHRARAVCQEEPSQLCWYSLWWLPQRRKWAAFGHGPRCCQVDGHPVSHSPCPCLVAMGKLGSGLGRPAGASPGAAEHFPGPVPKGKGHPAQAFPEPHFLWAAQEVVAEWD